MRTHADPRRHHARLRRRWRRGAVLVLTALLLPVLLGITGLVIDAGLLMVSSRKAQNAADAAATAAAFDLLLGRAVDTARATAVTYTRAHNQLTTANVTVNVPPSRGPYQGDPSYVEVIVQNSVRTVFIHMLGVNRDQLVRRRAVAGMKPINVTPGVIALDSAARPGISVGGNGSLTVKGNITVNSAGGGLDETGQAINNGNAGNAMSVSNNASIRATDMRVVGGVNNPSNFRQYDPTVPGTPLRTRALPVPDPFLYLPPPTVATGASSAVHAAVSVSGNTAVTLTPGVYPSIAISSGTVVFQPGIYIIRGGDLKVTEQNVTANGVMFYITGSDYDVHTGLPDSEDLYRSPPAAGSATFGGVSINAGLRFSGLSDASSRYNGMLFYQRRLNTKAFTIQGNSSAGNLAGTIYAKWAPMAISGQGTYGAQFIVKSMSLSGNGNVRIDHSNALLGRSSQVVLVE